MGLAVLTQMVERAGQQLVKHRGCHQARPWGDQNKVLLPQDTVWSGASTLKRCSEELVLSSQTAPPLSGEPLGAARAKDNADQKVGWMPWGNVRKVGSAD